MRALSCTEPFGYLQFLLVNSVFRVTHVHQLYGAILIHFYVQHQKYAVFVSDNLT